jgi:ribosome-associated translation inhibitor RaiA
MQVPVTVTFRSMDSSPAVETAIDRWVSRLAAAFDRIESCDVVIDLPHRHGRQGNVFHIRIEIAVPQRVITVSEGPDHDHAHEDVYVALADAFRAARRQLQDYARIQRGDVKLHA